MEPSEIAGQYDGAADRSAGGEPETHGAREAWPGDPPGRVEADGGALVPDGDLGVLERIEAELADVERALERLDEGTYGVCELCGRPIGGERLEATPATRVCADHGPAPMGGPPPVAG